MARIDQMEKKKHQQIQAKHSAQQLHASSQRMPSFFSSSVSSNSEYRSII